MVPSRLLNVPSVRPGGGSAFPATRPSVVQALDSPDAAARDRAFGTLVAIYWKPVYKYIRLRWNQIHEAGEDLTQEFFLQALGKGWLGRYDPSRARFRTFLRTCVDGHVANSQRAERRAKRGGRLAFVDMDFAAAEREFRDSAPPPDADVEAFFQQEWIRAVLELAMGRLRTESAERGKQIPFALFLRYDVEATSRDEALTYADLAREFALPRTQVTNFLAFARGRFRHHVLEALAELTGTEEEYAEAVREILGGAAP